MKKRSVAQGLAKPKNSGKQAVKGPSSGYFFGGLFPAAMAQPNRGRSLGLTGITLT